MNDLFTDGVLSCETLLLIRKVFGNVRSRLQGATNPITLHGPTSRVIFIEVVGTAPEFTQFLQQLYTYHYTIISSIVKTTPINNKLYMFKYQTPSGPRTFEIEVEKQYQDAYLSVARDHQLQKMFEPFQVELNYWAHGEFLEVVRFDSARSMWVP